MARLRDDHQEFVRRGAQIIAVGPDDAAAFRAYWLRTGIPFPGLADPDHRVARMYRQQVNLLKLGRMPLVIVIDGDMVVRYAHQGTSMADVPTNRVLLEQIDRLNSVSSQPRLAPSDAAG